MLSSRLSAWFSLGRVPSHFMQSAQYYKLDKDLVLV
jgi:hypothetical protein